MKAKKSKKAMDFKNMPAANDAAKTMTKKKMMKKFPPKDKGDREAWSPQNQ